MILSRVKVIYLSFFNLFIVLQVTVAEEENPINAGDTINKDNHKESVDKDSTIIEDISSLDLLQLEVVSKKIVLNPNFGIWCQHLQEEVITYRYEALASNGEKKEVLLEDRKQIPVVKDKLITRNSVEPDLEIELILYPALNCFPMEHDYLIQEIQTMIVDPSTEEYNFKDLESNYLGEIGHPSDVDRIVFGGQLQNGFFIEAGSVDSETSSDTLYFEIKHNWTGLLVEALPELFALGLKKHRKAYSIQTCLSIQTKPMFVNFDSSAVWRDPENPEIGHSMGGIVSDGRQNKDTQKLQCLPLYSILLALGNPTVHWISLDIEGAEFAVLKTIPWDKVDIQALTVETHMMGSVFPGDREVFLSYMESVGYRHIKDAHMGTNPLRQKLGTIDDLFVRKDVPLAAERIKTIKQEL